MSNIIFNKSVEFLAQIALFNEAYSKSGLDETISKRLLAAALVLFQHPSWKYHKSFAFI